MLLAWSRLEVPDEEGLTFFLSPFMAKKLQTRSEDDLLSSTADNHCYS
jgi:hypothetical protein